MISDIIRDVNKTDGKYCFDVTVVQSAYASIQPWPNPTGDLFESKKQQGRWNIQIRLTFALLPNIGNFVKICSMKTTSVALGPYFEDFIKTQIAQGRYNNASEVIRAGLRMLEDNSIRIAALKSEIEEGLNSGEAVDFDPAAHLKSLKASKRNA